MDNKFTLVVTCTVCEFVAKYPGADSTFPTRREFPEVKSLTTGVENANLFSLLWDL